MRAPHIQKKDRSKSSPVAVAAKLRAQIRFLQAQLDFHEKLSDAALNFLKIIEDVLKEKTARNALIVARLQKVIVDHNKSLAGLSGGRIKGAERNRSLATVVREKWMSEATDLRKKHPRWSLKDMAEHIRDRTPHGKKESGKSYSARIIRDAINGA